MSLSLNESCDLLRHWSKNLDRSVNDAIPAVKGALNPESSLPPLCPSHESAALLALTGVRQALDQVATALKEVQSAIREK